MLRNMLGPIFDLGLDQFLTQEIWQFLAILDVAQSDEITIL